MQPHLFLAHDGGLYDTRDSAWSRKRPLRPAYSGHARTIESASQFKAALRAGPYAWPGGYPLAFITHDGACLCFKCGRAELRQILDSIRSQSRDGWRVVGCEIMHAEESDDSCEHCGATIAAHERDSDNDSTND